MKPPIDRTQFGSITLGGVVYDHDVLVCPDATVKRRKKKLSKAVYGTSHTISLAEAKYVYDHGEGAETLIIGGGQYGRVELSGRVPRTQALRCRALSHARGYCDLERGGGQGDRTVPRHLLSRYPGPPS
jgi:hypothetical protein